MIKTKYNSYFFFLPGQVTALFHKNTKTVLIFLTQRLFVDEQQSGYSISSWAYRYWKTGTLSRNISSFINMSVSFRARTMLQTLKLPKHGHPRVSNICHHFPHRIPYFSTNYYCLCLYG